ncbi:MAG: hypothetical protein GX161_07945 [Firmicutes bacterium]|nr:hypothetical protein [Bacillota bacterium]
MEFAFSVMRTKRFGRVVASAAACVLVMGLSWTAGAVERALTGPAAGTIGLPQPLFGGILLDLVDDINRWLATSAQVAQHAKRLQPAEGELGAASLAIQWGEDQFLSLRQESAGSAVAVALQVGSYNHADIYQYGAGDMVAVSVQWGVDNRLELVQTGGNHTAVALQFGQGNRALLRQSSF